MGDTDVAILGGGLAGLSLAMQLRRRSPDLAVTVVDAGRRPAAERSSTVGESFAEVGSHYFREVIGLRDHLESAELPKFGLRFFVGNSPDLGERFEIGLLDPAIGSPQDGVLQALPLPTHQVDRARLENEMALRCRELEVDIREGTWATDTRLDRRRHSISLAGDAAGTLLARWVIFAGGPDAPGLSRERRSLDHRIRAAWLRVEGDLDVGRWSEQEAFLNGTLPGLRRLSTNHLMGPGYWIWIIPLPSGVTSIGVVVDRDAVKFAPSNLDELLLWLKDRDPRVHAELSRASVVDEEFHTVDVDAGAATSCFSEDRWAVVGGAAAMVDVLYSPGADLIAIGNSLVTDLVDRESRVGRIGSHCGIADRVFGGFVDGLAELYRGQYPHFGDPGLVASKVVWDSALYFGFHTLLFRHGMFGDPSFLARIRPELLAMQSLQSRVQGCFRRGRSRPLFDVAQSPVEWGAIEGLMDNYYGAETQPDDRALLAQLREGMAHMERMARNLDGAA